MTWNSCYGKVWWTDAGLDFIAAMPNPFEGAWERWNMDAMDSVALWTLWVRALDFNRQKREP